MKKPRTYQYFAVESSLLGFDVPWSCEDTAPTLALARKKRDQLAAKKGRDPEDPWTWRVVRVVQLVEVIDEPFCPVTGQRGVPSGR